MIVKLKDYEVKIGMYVARLRHENAKGRKDRIKQFDPNYDTKSEIRSVCAEIAVAKKFNLYFDGSVGKFKGMGPDLPPDVEVRCTHHPNGKLILREIEKEKCLDYRHVLCVGEVPTFRLAGYIVGRDAFRDEWEQDKDEQWRSWWIPQNELWAMDTFMEPWE